MALHSSAASMLKESLDETLEAARFCVEYRKMDDFWGENKSTGCLGYPSAILLFSLIDSLGSYFRKNNSIKILVDGKPVAINSSGWEHFIILNSKYFQQSLDLTFIKELYNKFRSPLSHNSVLGKNTIMFPGSINYSNALLHTKVFGTAYDHSGKIIHLVSIRELYSICKVAVDIFKEDIDLIVPLSKQAKGFR